MPPASISIAENSELPWYWEGNVQARVAKFLIAEDWMIVSAANTATRQRGIDLVATRKTQRLAVEVKGYPGTVYARGEKAGQPKPTAPTLQAKHWLAKAMLAAVLAGGSNEYTTIVIAFPDMPRYRDLVARIRYALDKLELRVLFVAEGGQVSELQSHLTLRRSPVDAASQE